MMCHLPWVMWCDGSSISLICSAWPRETTENTDSRLCQYFPSGADLPVFTLDDSMPVTWQPMRDRDKHPADAVRLEFLCQSRFAAVMNALPLGLETAYFRFVRCVTDGNALPRHVPDANAKPAHGLFEWPPVRPGRSPAPSGSLPRLTSPYHW